MNQPKEKHFTRDGSIMEYRFSVGFKKKPVASSVALVSDLREYFDDQMYHALSAGFKDLFISLSAVSSEHTNAKFDAYYSCVLTLGATIPTDLLAENVRDAITAIIDASYFKSFDVGLLYLGEDGQLETSVKMGAEYDGDAELLELYVDTQIRGKDGLHTLTEPTIVRFARNRDLIPDEIVELRGSVYADYPVQVVTNMAMQSGIALALQFGVLVAPFEPTGEYPDDVEVYKADATNVHKEIGTHKYLLTYYKHDDVETLLDLDNETVSTDDDD